MGARLLGRDHDQGPVGIGADEPVLLQAAQGVLGVVADARPAAFLEEAGDVLPDRLQRVVMGGRARKEGIEQHVLLHVLLLGTVGDQGERAVIVGEAAEIEVLRQHHHVAVARVEEAHHLAEDHGRQPGRQRSRA